MSDESVSRLGRDPLGNLASLPPIEQGLDQLFQSSASLLGGRPGAGSPPALKDNQPAVQTEVAPPSPSLFAKSSPVTRLGSANRSRPVSEQSPERKRSTSGLVRKLIGISQTAALPLATPELSVSLSPELQHRLEQVLHRLESLAQARGQTAANASEVLVAVLGSWLDQVNEPELLALLQSQHRSQRTDR